MGEKIKKGIVYGLLPIFLTINLPAQLSAVSLSSALVDLREKIVNRVFTEKPAEPNFIEVVATAYSSTPDQTDDTPFVTAANTIVRDGIVAANFLNFHTRIKIPELFGDKIFTVEDRMNRRYTEVIPPRIDVWLPSRWEARHFGVKKVKITVVDDSI